MAGSYVAFTQDELEQKYAAPSRTTSSCAGAACRWESTSCPPAPRTQQHPHMADEVYVVLKGQGRLRVVDEEIDVGPGSIVSVDHGEEHQFVNIAEDLALLVVFAPPDQPDEE